MDAATLKQRIIFRRIIQTLIVLGIFLMAVTSINHENDIFWQLKMGEDIVVRHFFPIHDIYSAPAYGQVWTLHEWLPSVIFYLIYSRLGAAALIIFKAAIVAATFWLFLLLFNILKVNLYISLLVFGLAALVNSRGVWVVFPSLFEYLFLVIILFLLEIYRRENALAISVFLSFFSLLWANSHGSFILLPIIVGAFVFGYLASNFLAQKYPGYAPLETNHLKWKELKFLLIPFFASLTAPFLTPNGYWTFLYPFRISLGKFTLYVSEYQKFWAVWNWNWSDFVQGFAFILMVSLAFIYVVARKRLNVYDLILGLFFAALTFSAARHAAVFALVALLLIAKYTKVWLGEYRGIFARSLLKDILAIILIVCSLYFYKTRMVTFGFSLSEDGYPKEAAELLNSSGLAGNMFNHYNYGGYLIWKMPNYKVFIDGRLEMYLSGVGDEYEKIISGAPGYQELLDKYKINFFLIYLTDPIVENLVNSPDWKYIYHDKQYVIFVRNVPQNQYFLAKYWNKERNEVFQAAYLIARNKFLAEYYNSLGLASRKKGNLMDAVGYFQQSAAYGPDFIPGHMNLARAFLEFGSFTEAKKEYEYILTLDPENQQAKRNLEQINELVAGGRSYRIRIW